jgi:hypothetical protein
MIERIIENWLDKASEKTYQLPFCYMLANEGYTVLHLTRHCGMEHGKDVIAINAEGDTCVFQLKGAPGSKIKLKEWQSDLLGQVNQMVLTPVNHPSIVNTKHHKSFLVTNGEIEEEVFHAISLINSDWEKRGQPQFKIETIVKGQLIEWANKLKTNFIPTEVADFKALLEFYLEDGKNILDKAKFSKLLDSVFLKGDISKNESKRIISSAALLCSLATANYTNENNHIAIIEAWMIYICSLLKFCEERGIKESDFNNELDIAIKIVINSLENLLEDEKDSNYFLVGLATEDLFVHNARLTWILGLFSSLGLYYKIKEKDNSNIAVIAAFIDKHKDKRELFGESAIPNFLSHYWFVRSCVSEPIATTIILQLLNSIVQTSNLPNLIYPNVYYGIDDAVSFNFEIDPTVIEQLSDKHHSYTLDAVLNLVVRENQKDFLKEVWPSISRYFFVEFQYTNIYDYYSWRNSIGTEVIKTPKPTQEWKELSELANESEGKAIPEILKKHPYLMPIFLIVFPHRITSGVVRWFDTVIASYDAK